jgi:hypothetical protein
VRSSFDRRVLPDPVLGLVRVCQRHVPAHLAGGAALSGAHLSHRLSGDVDRARSRPRSGRRHRVTASAARRRRGGVLCGPASREAHVRALAVRAARSGGPSVPGSSRQRREALVEEAGIGEQRQLPPTPGKLDDVERAPVELRERAGRVDGGPKRLGEPRQGLHVGVDAVRRPLPECQGRHVARECRPIHRGPHAGEAGCMIVVTVSPATRNRGLVGRSAVTSSSARPSRAAATCSASTHASP